LDTSRHKRFTDGVLVVDNQSKMTAVVCGLLATFLQRQELIAEIDER
jgi:hypothetical protein